VRKTEPKTDWQNVSKEAEHIHTCYGNSSQPCNRQFKHIG